MKRCPSCGHYVEQIETSRGKVKFRCDSCDDTWIPKDVNDLGMPRAAEDSLEDELAQGDDDE